MHWRGRGEPQEQVANACDWFVNLTPVSQAAAVATRTKWSALLPGQTVPLIWEDNRHGNRFDEEDDGQFC